MDKAPSRRTILKLAGAAALGGMVRATAQLDQLGNRSQAYCTLLDRGLDVGPALFRPTANGCTVQWITTQKCEIRIMLAHRDRAPMRKFFSKKGVGPGEFVIDSLEPGRSYRMQLIVRGGPERGQESAWETDLRTTPPPGSTFHVALIADSHFHRARNKPRDVRNFGDTRRAVYADGADFVIFLGDEALVHYTDEEAPEMSQAVAMDRWRDWRRECGELLATVPSFMVLGNHEGECGFYESLAYGGGAAYLQRWGTIARKQFFLNPTPTTYPEGGENEEWSGDTEEFATGGASRGNCSPLQNYYAWTWGDALFVVLDVNRYTQPGGTYPTEPGQWSLGEAQLRWFERTLAASKSRWKIVVAHHVVGGYHYDLPGDEYYTDYVYGRGGAHYDQVGEQARVSALMREYGAQIFLYGHDHIFAHQPVDGIHYVCCGRPTFLQDEWWRTRGWMEAYGDAEARDPNDFYGAIGFTRLTVSPDVVRVEYVCSGTDRQERENVKAVAGDTIYCEEILHPDVRIG